VTAEDSPQRQLPTDPEVTMGSPKKAALAIDYPTTIIRPKDNCSNE
jgi:hypothetical protein